MADAPQQQTEPGPWSPRLVLKFFAMYWRTMFFIIWPLVILPVVIGEHTFNGTDESNAKFRCMYCIMLMCGYWLTECIPGSVTGMMPMFLFPFFNILSPAETLQNYFQEVNFMFVGSILVALCVEFSGLHKRLALMVITCIGADPKRILMGFISVTMTMSAFMVNSACTAMMCPIVKAIIESLENEGIGSFYRPQTQEDIDAGNNPIPTKATTGYYCAVAYAATSGGLITIVGTATTLAYKGLIESTFPEAADPVSFVPWLLFCGPITILVNIVIWFWILVINFGMLRPKSKEAEYTNKATENQEIVKVTLKERLKELGNLTWHEAWVMCLFIILILLWFFRQPKFMPGWTDLFISKYIPEKESGKFVANTVPTLFVLSLLLLIPATYDCAFACSDDESKRPKKITLGLGEWARLVVKMSWGLMFMLGGGFCLAAGGTATGMTDFIGYHLKSSMEHVHKFIILIIVVLAADVTTEFTSNVAIANVILPPVFSLSKSLKISPLYFGHPVGMACSYSFMMPVGTPPNAIIAGYAGIQTSDMMVTGSFPKLFSYLILLVFPWYGGLLISDVNIFPKWAE